jgi:hypothetical protein
MSRVNLNDTVKAIKGHEIKEPDWLQTPYCGLVTIVSVHFSELVTYPNGDPYTGTPYFQFNVLTESGEKTSIKLWRPKKDDSEEKSNRKLDKIKKFMEHAGVDSTKDGEDYFQSVVGKKLQVVINMQEQLNLEDVPKIENRLSFWFSKPADEFIEMDQDRLFTRLSPADMKRFEEAKDAYDKSEAGKSKKTAIQESQGEEFDSPKSGSSEVDNEDF